MIGALAPARATAMEPQFDIVRHYDVMEQLDRDVHDDARLSMTEVDVALDLIDCVPKRVFLPCCGTGRHIPRLLERGVREIVGVDLSPRCLAKARRLHGSDSRVTFVEADLLTWQTDRQFEAVILLGNSFADQVNPQLLLEVTRGMTRPLMSSGIMVMDYVGIAYLNRLGRSTTWGAELDGQPVNDRRTPRYDPYTGVMTIDVEVTDLSTGAVKWIGAYQKRILDEAGVVAYFNACGVRMTPRGNAVDLNRSYYGGHAGELGMIAASTWWVGNKE